MKCMECSYSPNNKEYGKFTCPQCKTVNISSVSGGKRTVSEVKHFTHGVSPSLGRVGSSLPLKHALCAGCAKVIDTTFAVYGSILKPGKGGFTRIKSEFKYYPELDQMVEELTECFLPLSPRAKGFICEDCLTSKSVTHKRRDGSSWTEPIVKVIPRVSSTQSLNPGWSREDRMDPLPPLKKIIKGKMVVGIEKPLIDASCYTKFGHNPRGGMRRK